MHEWNVQGVSTVMHGCSNTWLKCDDITSIPLMQYVEYLLPVLPNLWPQDALLQALCSREMHMDQGISQQD